MTRFAVVAALGLSLLLQPTLHARSDGDAEEQASNGTITGQVLSASTGAPLANHYVYAYQPSPYLFSYALTNTDGVYSISAPPGTYAVYVPGSNGYVTQIYPGINCASCNYTSGKPIVVTSNATATNVNFSVVLGGRITGTVYDEFENRMPNVQLEFYDSTGNWVDYAYTDGDGGYTTSTGLTTRSYFARTIQISEFIDEAFGGNWCYDSYCDITAVGYPINVTIGNLSAENDFFLDHGAQFKGRVTGPPQDCGGLNDDFTYDDLYYRWAVDYADYGAAYAYEYAGQLYLENYGFYSGASAFSSASITSRCLAHGDFDAIVDLSLDYWTTGSSVYLSLGDLGTGKSTGIFRQRSSFDGLEAYRFYSNGSLYGTLIDNRPIASGRKLRLRRVGTQLQAYAWNGDTYNLIGTAPVPKDDTGFTLGMDGIDYDADYNVVRLDNFTVDADAIACEVSNVSVDVKDEYGSTIRSVSTDEFGRYESPGLPDGLYKAHTYNWEGLIDEAWDNITCVNCSYEGDLIPVSAESLTTRANFSLEWGSHLYGRITDTSGNPVPSIQVSVYDSDNTWLVYGYTDSNGDYYTRALPDGRYYAVASSYSGAYKDVLYNGKLCEPTCDPNTGDPIDLAYPASFEFEANFVLTPAGRITGIVTAAGGGALNGVAVQIYDGSGTLVQAVTTNTSGYYSVDLSAGTYYLRTANTQTYVDQIYSGIACLAFCYAPNGTPIVIGAGTNITANFTLTSGARFSGRITAETGGAALMGATAYVYNSANDIVATGTADALGDFTTTPFPTGLSYIVARAGGSFVHEAWNNIICPSCIPSSTTGVNATVGTTTGFNFALTTGGWIYGNVTGAGAGLSGVFISYYNAAGVEISYSFTDGSGNYAMNTAVPPGNYFARTIGAPGALVDELYNNIPCDPTCTVTIGTPIAVLPNAYTNVNFQLEALGNIAGVITNASTTAAIQGVEVRLFNSAGVQQTTTTTNVSGAYSFTGLAPGTYYLRTFNTLSFFDELYNDLPCAVSCSVLSGTGIAVVAGATPTANFALTPGARIAGRVTDVATGLGIQNVSIRVYGVLGQLVLTQATDPSGNYQTGQALPTGTYYAVTSNSGGYIDEMYGDVLWEGGTPGGSPISATAGTTTNNINFSLGTGGRISGHVTRSADGTPVVGASVDVYDASGAFRTTGVTDATGAYVTQAGLPPSTYFARTSNAGTLINERFDNMACLGCSPALGTPIPVTDGTTPGIDFALANGATLSGSVFDDADATALATVTLTLWDASGHSVGSAVTSGPGTYSFTGLPAGSYFLSTDNALGYINEAFNNVSCNNCVPSSVGTPIVLGAGASATANFALVRGGRVAGRVTSSSGGAGINAVAVRVYSSAGALVTTGSTDVSGNYVSRAGLPAGNYYLTTTNVGGFLDELYNNIACLGCTNVTSGTAVPVTLGVTAANNNFSLDPGGRISGTVTDVNTGLPIYATVLIYNASGAQVSSGETTATGSYTTGAGLPSGTYYARTINTRGYIDRRYNNVQCHNPCTTVTLGAPIAVTLGITTPNINFTLARGGRISGRVTNDPPTITFGGGGVNIYSASGAFVSSTTVDANGEYITSGLPAATYFARSANTQGYIDELYDGQTCFGCAITAGTPIPVVVGQTAANRNFSLSVPGGLVSGRVTSGVAPFAGIPNVEVRLFNEEGQVSVLTDASGNYQTPAVPTGTYRAIAAPSSGYDTRLYDNILCAGCDPFTGTPIAVTVGAITGNKNFVLQPAAPKITLSAYAFEGSGQTVTATIENGPGHRYDWVALYPVNNSNTGYVAGPLYLNGQATPPAVGLSTASVVLPVPTAPGLYNVRLISALGPALALSGSITVTSQPTVTLSTLSVPAGGPVVATVANGPGYRYDYVGFYPKDNNNTGYVEFKYLNGTQTAPVTGLTNANVQFTTPTTLPPGLYNVRLISSSGSTTITATSATLTVSAPPTITLATNRIPAGFPITATVAGGPGGRFDYVGFYPIGNGPTGFITFKYLNNSATAPATGVTGGSVTFTTLSTLTPGQYNIRFLGSAGNVMATSAALTVTAPPSLTVSPTTVLPGASYTVTAANGPGYMYDYIGFYPAGNPITGYLSYDYLNGSGTPPPSGLYGASYVRTAPATPGSYLLRWVTSTGELTNVTLTVANPPAVTVSPTTAPSGATVTATVTNGPNTRFSYVGLFPIANANGGFLELKYLSGTSTPPASAITGTANVLFTMPATPGSYNVRLFDQNANLLSTSPTITVTAPTIALSATSVAVGATVTATIGNGPGNRYNWVGLFPVANGNTGYIDSKYLNGLQTPPASGLTDAAVTFTMPATPGQYNIRLFPHDSNTPIKTSGTITVTAAPSLGVQSTTVTAGSNLIVTAAGGPGARWDWVGLFPVANSNTGFVSFKYLNDTTAAPAVGQTGGTLNFTMPTTPGQYNFRFFYTYGNGTPIFTSVTVTVVP